MSVKAFFKALLFALLWFIIQIIKLFIYAGVLAFIFKTFGEIGGASVVIVLFVDLYRFIRYGRPVFYWGGTFWERIRFIIASRRKSPDEDEAEPGEEPQESNDEEAIDEDDIDEDDIDDDIDELILFMEEIEMLEDEESLDDER